MFEVTLKIASVDSTYLEMSLWLPWRSPYFLFSKFVVTDVAYALINNVFEQMKKLPNS